MATDISDNRLNIWNFCPKSYALQYIDGWTPIVKEKSFNKGGWFHLGVETALKGLIADGSSYATCSAEQLVDRFEKMKDEIITAVEKRCYDDSSGAYAAGTLTDERAADFSEQCEAAIWMTMHYLQNLAPFLAHKMIIGIEIKFEDIFDTYSLTVKNRGIIDLVLFDPFDQVVYVIDHKSAADLLDVEKRLTHSVQHVGYVRWVKQMIAAGKQIDVLGSHGKVTVDLTGAKVRTVFRIVRSKIPKYPKILKNGSISSAAISTIRPVYEEALLSVQPGQPPTEKQLDRLASLPETWTTTVEPVVTDEDIALWEQEMAVAAARMDQATKLPIYQTRNTRNCHECRLVNVCKLDDDPDFERKRK